MLLGSNIKWSYSAKELNCALDQYSVCLSNYVYTREAFVINTCNADTSANEIKYSKKGINFVCHSHQEAATSKYQTAIQILKKQLSVIILDHEFGIQTDFQ